MVGRMGGDEFVVLCEHLTDDARIEELADQVTAALRDPFSVQGTEVVLTASIGMAIGRAGDDPVALLSSADAAMYRAKELGRDRRVRFDHSIRLHAQQRFSLELELRQAVEDGQMRLVYQPVVDLETGAIVGAEALVRWDHPTRGEVSPNEFIPLAEEIGLIVPLGAWVLEEACRSLVVLRAVDPAFTMAVNVSARQLHQQDFPDVVAEILERTGTDASDVILEVTETVLMADADLFVEVLGTLRALGLHLAVDDFGTGFSSLAYLQRFPVDIIKIDRSFVERGCTSSEATALVAAILAMAGALGLRAVAEGVETEAQLACLRELGCAQAQGFLFATPRSVPEVLGLVAAGARW
jgi:EAL domain-containing protein (putative c-di-GMP-specific phosphodiesterase class I)